MSKKLNTLKLCDLLSPPPANTKGLSGFDARHSTDPKLLFFSQTRVGSIPIISHTFMIPSFAELTRKPGHDELRDKPNIEM